MRENTLPGWRAKIETDPTQPARILTVWGRGYKFAASEEQQT